MKIIISTAWIQLHLAKTLTNLKNFKRAKELTNKGLATYREYYGKNHIKTAKALKILGYINLNDNNLNSAEDFFNRALEIFQNNHHTNSFLCLELFSDLYFKKYNNTNNATLKKQYKANAIKYLNKALKIAINDLPADSICITKLQEKLLEYTAM